MRTRLALGSDTARLFEQTYLAEAVLDCLEFIEGRAFPLLEAELAPKMSAFREEALLLPLFLVLSVSSCGISWRYSGWLIWNRVADVGQPRTRASCPVVAIFKAILNDTSSSQAAL